MTTMVKAILGKKLGMTQVFAENGDMIPVTVLKAGPCVVMQRKTAQTDGYEAAQLGLRGSASAEASEKAFGGTFQEGEC